VRGYGGGWKPGGMVRVEGVLTRDSVGGLLVASSVTRNGEVLDLRDSKGHIRWDELTQPFRSARSLSEVSIATSDGSSHPVVSWILNVELGGISYLCLDVDGTLRALPWTAVERSGDAWQVSYDRRGLPDLPEVTSIDSQLQLP